MSVMPPLQALRTFVEVAKQGSIKGAAEALHVTPGAVSQQMRLLEERLNTELLQRERLGMRLTYMGEKLYPMLNDAFAQVDRAMDMVAAHASTRTLTISTVAAFAASWLVPRLGRFTQQYPHIEVRVETGSDLVDMRKDRVDIALRHGLGDYPELDVLPLMAPVLVPVAADSLLQGHALREPIDCLNYPLLHDVDRADWSLWLRAHGVQVDERARSGGVFEDDYLLIRAAESGQGIALIPEAYAREEIKAGRLVQVLDKPWPARFAYYIVTRPGAAKRAEVQAFIEWVSAEAAAM
ncbi:LysR family transcriptional regulator [Alcaligenaceae bacterium 429]|uniref:LysR substrate-binding domain-containing protein n=1 Tax=Paenalcaligenes sp. Me52 TaxID=3392038 RepID=UPI001091E07E|nr:LysR family transcriptional regulator [Alcaligenaceae bacterium 429]